jgi:hypothetical protein
MQDLVELANLLNRTKLKGNGALQYIIESGSKMEALFHGLLDKSIQSDDDAKAVLKEEGSKLVSQKNKLKERLLDAVFLLDFKEANFTSRQKAYAECSKKWAVCMNLLVRNAKITGIDQMEKLLRHSIQFEFTEMTLDILRVLKLQYSTIDGDQKKYQDVKALYQKHERIWIMESKAEEYYSELMIHYTNNKSTQRENTALAQQYFDALGPFMETCDSFKLHLFGRLVQLMIHSTVNDYAPTAALCEDAIAFFDKKDYDSGLPLQVFYYNLVVCYLQLREFEKGHLMIQRCEYFFEEGSFNWFKLQELFFLLAMHTGHYDEAWKTYERVVRYPKFDEKIPQIVEMWKIYEAYVHFLAKIGKISAETVGDKPVKFKLSKFLNELQMFSKDKRGMNSSILIAQLLFTIAERNYDQSIDYIERIEKYCSRYLKDPDTFRSNTFIKMLLQIPQGSFHREAVRRKAERHQKQLLAVPLESANQTHEIEIIPFEQLWDLTLESLDLKIYKGK